jgi:hypothetical protein
VIIGLQRILHFPPATKNYVMFCLIMVLIVCWRIDLGYAGLLSVMLVLFFYLFRKKHHLLDWKKLFRVFFVTLAAVFVLIGAASLWRHQNFFGRFDDLINYCMSAQSYGYFIIGDPDLESYKILFYVFPAIAAVLLLLILFKISSFQINRPLKVTALSLIFLLLFYFLNFNRGITRHSLLEGDDCFTTSFIYLIIPSAVYIFSKRMIAELRFFSFCLIAFFLTTNYKIPSSKNNRSQLDGIARKLATAENADLAKFKGRVRNVPKDAGQHYKPFVDFITDNTSEKQTFIDFDNKPMLYYHTQKESPSWFYQNPLCIHNDFLQNEFLSGLQTYDAPYLVFNELNTTGYDMVDRVPNQVRHYRMAEFFYQNYVPYVILGKYCVWKRNDIPDKNNIRQVFKFLRTPGDSVVKINSLLKSFSNKKYLVKILFNDKGSSRPLICQQSSPHSKKNYLQEYKVDGHTSYAIVETTGKLFWLTVSDDARSVRHLSVWECDHVPDFIADKYLTMELKNLPFIWGNFDEKLMSEKVLFSRETGLFNGNDSSSCRVIIPAPDRTTGNTVVIHCTNRSSKLQKMYVMFGLPEKKDRNVISFDLLPKKGIRRYAIRISSFYTWYLPGQKELSTWSPAGNDVKIHKLEVTKGL